jgi:hypothetical protein
MSTSRRRFLKTSVSLAAALPLLRSPSSAAPAAAKAAGGVAAPPPEGLLFDRADLPRLRDNLALPRFAKMRADILGADLDADRRFLEHEIRLHNRVTDLSRVRIMLERTSFAFALFGDERQLAVARRALRRLMDYERWDYFLEGGEHTIGLQRAPEASIAVVFALDWLGDALTAEERALAEEQLGTKGAPACYRTLYGMKYPDRVRGWGFDPTENFPAEIDFSRWPLILNTNNLKVIPLCGLGFAALWLRGRHLEAEKWLEMARQSARAFSTIYGLDGSYDEGLGYWGYTTLHLALFAEILRRRLGIDETKLINYPGSTRFALALTMPTLGTPFINPNETSEYNFVPKGVIDPALDLVNFGDSGVGAEVSVASWIGDHHNDPVSHYIAHNVGGIQHLPGVIWYRPDAPTAPPEDSLLDVRFVNDWVISRTGWTARDTVVAFRSGGPANHEHADRNSVIFKAHGERLFHDPFKAGYDPKGPRWLLRLTAAHTAVLIGGQGHQYHDGREGTNSSWAEARITDYRIGSGWMIATSDATDAYQLVNDAVEHIERSVIYLKPDVLLLLDRVKLKSQAARPVQVRFQVNNEDNHGRASARQGGFEIHRPHAHLRAQVHAARSLTTRLARHDLPKEEGDYPFIEVESPAAATHDLLTVCAAAPTAETIQPFNVQSRPGGWHITGTHRRRPVDVTINLTRPATEIIVDDRRS